MQCEYCQKILSTLSTLKHHQKTVKYCLAKQNKEPVKEYTCSFCGVGFAVKSTLNSHLRICKSNTPIIHEQLQLLDSKSKDLDNSNKKILECNRIIDEQKIIIKELHLEYNKQIEEQKKVIKELHADYKKQIDMQNKDFHDRMQSMAEKAIDKPSTVTKNNTTQIINNLLPITNEHLNEQVQFLTKEHVTNGAVGYAKYALEFPLKDRLICTDSSRKKGKYKDSDGNIVSDPEMTSITRKLFLAIKDRNATLIDEHALDLKVKLDQFNSCSDNEMDDDESKTFSSSTDQLIDYITAAYSQKRQSREMSEGLKPELFQEFVKELSSGCFLSK
jgi:hypothetical protein